MRRTMKNLLAVMTIMIVLSLSLQTAAAELSFEVFSGAPLILDTTLTISQSGHPDLDLDPSFDTEPFAAPPFYALRLGLRRGEGVWAIELLHQKMMLRNPPPEVQNFQISHGYNILTVQHLRRVRGVKLTTAAGIVITHPENQVRGLTLNEKTGLGDWGYHLSGVAVGLGVGETKSLGEHLFLTGEMRLVASRVVVPVADGDATLVDLTAYVLLGVGLSF